MEFEKKRNLALVLSGGSARGLAHIGFLEVLNENQIPVDAVVGTSMGALVGGLYAAGTLDEFKKKIIGISNNKLAGLFLSRKLRKMNTKTEDIIPFLEDLTKKKKIEDLGVAFTAIATNLKTGEEVFINKGSLLKAILASIALPGIFKPIEFGNKLLVDGSVIDPLPEKYGQFIANKVIAVNAMPKNYKYVKHGEDVFEVLSRASGIMANALLNIKSLANFNLYDKERFLFVQLKTDKIGPFDFYDVKRIIRIGRKAAKKNIKKIIRLVKE